MQHVFVQIGDERMHDGPLIAAMSIAVSTSDCGRLSPATKIRRSRPMTSRNIG
jgi:hypothetical protein